MKSDWPRAVPPIAVDAGAAATLIRPALRHAQVVRVAPAAGGLANTNLEVELGGPPHRVLLRLYQCEAARACKEAALARLLAGKLPVARFIYFAESNDLTGAPYAVLEWIA